MRTTRVKKMVLPLLLLATLVVGQPAQAGFLSRLVNALSQIPFVGDYVDNRANRKAQSKVDAIIEADQLAALNCTPLESDGSATVHDLIKMKPGYPDWRKLDKFKDVTRSAAELAKKKSANDKVQHCYAGCIIRKRLDHSSGVLAAFMKELHDASDCSVTTHFEMQDYYATVAGSIAGGKTSCDNFCLGTANATRTGGEMLAAAKAFSVRPVRQPIRRQVPSQAPEFRSRSNVRWR